MNKFKAVFISALVLISMSAISAPKVYGKLNIALNNDGSDGVNEKEIDLISNASRLGFKGKVDICLLYTSPSPRDLSTSRMTSSA